MTNLKLFCFAKGSASAPIYAVCSDKINEDALKVEASKVSDKIMQVLAQLRSIELRPEQRQKINTGNGSWFCKKDDKEVIYMMLTNGTYPERLIYEAMNELRDQLLKLGKNYASEQDSSLKNHARGPMQQIMTKYENPKQVDKIAVVNSNLEDVRSSVRSSVRKILTNQVQLEDLQQKSMTLRDHASQFSKSANELERMMYWRNCKLKIVIGLVVVSILCFILVPIIVKATGNSSPIIP